MANVGDMAYSAAELRQRAREQGTEIVARMPPSPGAKGYFPKDDFHLDLDEESVTCPAGHTTQRSTRHSDGGRTFFFNGKVCAGCPLRSQCTRQDRDRMLRTGKGRSIAWHALEPVLQAARAAEATPGVQKLLGLRWMVEQGIAHLMRRGLRRARYRSTPKVRFQALMAALVTNLVRSRGLPSPNPLLRSPVERGVILVPLVSGLRRIVHRLVFTPPWANRLRAVAVAATEPFYLCSERPPFRSAS